MNIENDSSDIYFYILAFLLENKPIMKSNVLQHEKYMNSMNSKKENDFNCFMEKTNNLLNKNPTLIATPNLKSKLSPSIILSKSPILRHNKKDRLIENFDLKLNLIDNSIKDKNDDNKVIIHDYFGKRENTIEMVSIKHLNQNELNKENKTNRMNILSRNDNKSKFQRNFNFSKENNLIIKSNNNSITPLKRYSDENNFISKNPANETFQLKKIKSNSIILSTFLNNKLNINDTYLDKTKKKKHL